MPYAAEHPALTKSRLLAQARLDLQQFGQSDDEYAWNGATACTHVILQFLALLWLKRFYTIDQVSKLAGYPYQPRGSNGQPRGMSNTEFARFCTAVGLPYSIRFGLSFDTMHGYTTRGPVFLGVRHGSIPEKRGFVYFGKEADGYPNGFARLNGRTQLAGFEDGRHAVLDLGSRKYIADSATVTATCDTILRRSASITSDKVGHISKGDKVRVTRIVTGSHWSGCGKSGTKWLRVIGVNGRTSAGTPYMAAGLATTPTFGVIREDLWHKDPNHNSGSRPENPPYDVISKGQARTEYNHFQSRLGSMLYGAIPTRSLV